MFLDTHLAHDRVVPAGVARVGYNINEMWNVSVGAAVGWGWGTAQPGVLMNNTSFVQPFAAITWTPNLNKSTSPFVTAGAGFTTVYDPRMTAQYGVHLGVGVRQMVSDNLAVRLEGREQYEHYSEFSNAAWNGIVSLGLSYFLGGGRLKDSDGDGVPDKYDRCPNTPRGAIVDARGCPIDSDHDGVPDGIDRCPNTPAGVRVDAVGCPIDSDGDGVPDYFDRCPNTPAGIQVYPATDAARAGCPLDSDGDGVPDYLDRCPDTPHGAPVYTEGPQAGCPKDSDGDGVPDYLDRCPDTPHGVTVDANGCPIDSDHDGVPDYRDKCPNTAAGVPVDADGCPIEKDSDADGVPDSRDKCPNTPHGVRVDPDGCPLFELPAVSAAVVMRNVNFRVGSAVLLPLARAELDRIAIAIKLEPNTRWEIGGYTSNTGSVAVNTRLSGRRADAVKNYLVSKGVASASLTAEGYGPLRPIGSNRTARGRDLNRRVEIKRLQ